MPEWQGLSPVRWECQYHVVMIPKYRRKVLYGRLRRRIGVILRELCRQRGIELLEGHAMPDHVHLFVRVGPADAPASVVRAFKGRSARVLRQEFPYLRNRAKVVWSPSYLAASVG